MSTMLYKKGTELRANNLWDVDTIVALDETEVKELISEGWFLSPIEAHYPDEKVREKALAEIVKKSARHAAANAAANASQNLDPTGSNFLVEPNG